MFEIRLRKQIILYAFHQNVKQDGIHALLILLITPFALRVTCICKVLTSAPCSITCVGHYGMNEPATQQERTLWAGLSNKSPLVGQYKCLAIVFFRCSMFCCLNPRRDTTCFRLTSELIFMAKRRAEEDTLLHGSPSKRCCRLLHSGDMQLHSAARTGGVSLSPPPSLMALLGSRCRKRPYNFEDPDKQAEAVAGTAGFYYKTTQCDTRKHAPDVLTVQTSGGFQERRTSSTSTSTKDKKRQREDYVCPNTAVTKANELLNVSY